jgi:hypothetical protein
MSMIRSKMAVTVVSVALVLAIMTMRPLVHAQAPARGDASDLAVAALVTEIRALRADLAAASRNQLRAQMLLGRVQMQEQRLAYLDKQRSDAAGQVAALAQMTSGLRTQVEGFKDGQCAALPSSEQRGNCEAQGTALAKLLAEQDARDQQLRAQERDLETALSTEQARWSEFNSRLDELERTLR